MNQPNIWNASDPYPNYGSWVDLNYIFKSISTANVGGTNITGTKTKYQNGTLYLLKPRRYTAKIYSFL